MTFESSRKRWILGVIVSVILSGLIYLTLNVGFGVLKNFFNSNFFVGFVAFIAGLTAFLLYQKQKVDSKISAANIILLEIESAERMISQVMTSVQANDLPESKYLMPTASWNDNKFLFVRDFDRDEFDTITEFYHNCFLYDAAIKYKESLFTKNEESLRSQILRLTADFLEKKIEIKLSENIEIDSQQMSDISKMVQDNLIKHEFTYYPDKPINDAKRAIANLTQKISITSIGSKLKNIARI